jgi:dehydrogenase/reductase SDR family protein 4
MPALIRTQRSVCSQALLQRPPFFPWPAVKAAIVLSREAVRHMPPGSAIVYTSSYTAFNPAPPIAMYAVSKTTLLGLTKGLAEELGPERIRVNCVAPGLWA